MVPRDLCFKTEGNRNWVFTAEDEELFYPDGKPYVVRLYCASDITIKRHIKIRGEANPFDSKFEIYFEERMTSKMRNNLKGSKRLLNLWLNQCSNCPICRREITDDMQWILHYITRKIAGGSNNLSNLRFAHHDCHKKVCGHKLEDVKSVAKSGLRKA